MLDVTELSFAWAGRAVLDRVSLSLAPGTTACLEGANGAGKTTLLRLLAGALEPGGGSVSLAGEDIRANRRAYLRRVTMLAAGDRGLYARLSLRDNVDVAAAVGGVDPRRRRDRIADVMAALELGELGSRRADRLSIGQRQRVRLACALVCSPSLLLLDEPTMSLDTAGAAVVAGAVARAAGEGISVLWAVPEDEPGRLPADRVLRLADGHVELRP